MSDKQSGPVTDEDREIIWWACRASCPAGLIRPCREQWAVLGEEERDAITVQVLFVLGDWTRHINEHSQALYKILPNEMKYRIQEIMMPLAWDYWDTQRETRTPDL